MMPFARHVASAVALFGIYSIVANDMARSYINTQLPSVLAQGQRVPSWLESHTGLGELIADRCMDSITYVPNRNNLKAIEYAVSCVQRFNPANTISAYAKAIELHWANRNFQSALRLARDCERFPSCLNFSGMDVSEPRIAQLQMIYRKESNRI